MTDVHAEPSVMVTGRQGNGRWARLAFVALGTLLAITANLVLHEKGRDEVVAASDTPGPTSFVVGDCVVMSAGADAAGIGLQRSDCATDPSYTVGAVYDGDQECDGPNYADHSWTVGGKPDGRICLVQNLAPGHCYRVSPATVAVEQVDCAAASDQKEFKVVVRTDSLDVTPCPDGVVAYTYPVPPRTYCLANDPLATAEP